MKYLIIQLSDSSASLCNYNPSQNTTLISLDKLEEGLSWGVKNGLNIQILFPDFVLPQSYLSLIDKYEHIKIGSPKPPIDKDIFIIEDINELSSIKNVDVPVVLHLTISQFLDKYINIAESLSKFCRLNICFRDTENFTDALIEKYENALTFISDKIFEHFVEGNPIQFNLLTDRTMLTEMNNCNAGVDSITLAPDGKFYICPAFYLSSLSCIGSPEEDIHIPNSHLYQLSFAPICRACDAYHCKRCIYLNLFFTNEVNTPGHKQCIMSHVERKISRKLLNRIREFGDYAPGVSIPQLNYIDPFDKIINNA